MKRLAAGLAVVTVVRLVVAALAPLAPDETYYWVWSHALAAGYLDHPPMVALWIRAGTTLLGENALGVRLFGPLSAALASLMLFDAGRVLFPGAKAGIVAAALLNASLLLGVGTVVMTPDSPLLFFWTATLWAMARIAAGGMFVGADGRVLAPSIGVRAWLGLVGPPAHWLGTSGKVVDGRAEPGHDRFSSDAFPPDPFPGDAHCITAPTLPVSGVWWLVAGGFGGLALDSKYTALFLWIGIGLWALLVPCGRQWLRRWQPWVACAIGLASFAPVLAWNAAHGWAGFIRQGGRIEDWRPARSATFLAELVGGQIGLATPLVWGFCMAGLVVAVRRTWQGRDPAWSLLAALSLPPVLVFVQHALGDRVQGNWPAIIYPALAVAAGGLAIGRRWVTAAAALGLGMTALAYVQATTQIIPVPPRLDPIALRLAGWDGLASEVRETAGRNGASFVAADGYGLASELAWWLPPGILVAGTDRRWALTTLPVVATAGRSGLLVRDARRSDPPDPAAWTDVRRIQTLARSGSPGATFAVYSVRAVVDLAGLPNRAR